MTHPPLDLMLWEDSVLCTPYGTCYSSHYSCARPGLLQPIQSPNKQINKSSMGLIFVRTFAFTRLLLLSYNKLKQQQ